jgi:uncharacterized protein (TIGR02246 family)
MLLSRSMYGALLSAVALSSVHAQASTRPKASNRRAVPAVASPATNLADDTAAVNTVVRAYGTSLVGAPPDPAKTAVLFAPDGEMLPPGGTAVVGPDAIREMLAGFSKFVVESAEMLPTSTTVLGSRAMSWGEYRQRAIPPGQPAVNVGGRYAMELVRQADGRWLVRRLMVQPR